MTVQDSTRILVIGDSYMSAQVLVEALSARGLFAASATVTDVLAPTWPVSGLLEYEGDPAEVSSFIEGHEVLAIHGAPITREVLVANPSVRLIACARGGPVNVDLVAARELGVTVTTTPGKNADAVADLTIGLIIGTLRHVLPAVRSVDEIARVGAGMNGSAFEGARWFGHELRDRRLGLVGLGHVARLVAERASALGMVVSGFDPFVAPGAVEGVTQVDELSELLVESDVVTIHARATVENRHLIGARALATLPRGAILINTARESLVDEDALVDALRSGQLAGAALDVVEADGRWRDLVQFPNVTLTPHAIL